MKTIRLSGKWRTRGQNNQRGVVVVEAMVAILIFSLGILGIIGLLAASTRNSAEARYRNEASMLAEQLVGQMWAADKSSAALIAAFDSPAGDKYATWKTKVGSTLPGVTGVDSNAPTVDVVGNVATITVKWQAPGETAAHRFVLVARIENGSGS